MVANQVMAATPAPKVTICHKDPGDPDTTIIVGGQKLAAKHISQHGDHLGECNVCGDGNTDDLEACDDDNSDNTDACTNVCELAACGDTHVQPGNGETCDDGNTSSGDGCSSTCQTEAVCGDGTVSGSEQCDDGDTDSGDGCDGSCQIELGYNCTGEPSICELLCGDGNLDAGEQCDDGGTSDGDGCSSTCVTEFCGDGIINNVNEVCDDGNLGGESCISQGFPLGGSLFCEPNCETFDTSFCNLD